MNILYKACYYQVGLSKIPFWHSVLLILDLRLDLSRPRENPQEMGITVEILWRPMFFEPRPRGYSDGKRFL